jgi:hypothetical protein
VAFYASLVATELPDGIDPNLGFFSPECGGDDFLFDSSWHTFPGRMAAYCPHVKQQYSDYRVSAYELPEDLPDTTRAWVAGFLSGSLPRPPDSAWDEEGNERPEVMERWKALALQFRRVGWWPPDEDAEAFYLGSGEMPTL